MNILSKHWLTVVFLLLFSLTFSAQAEDNKKEYMDYMKPYKGSKEFEKLKSLSGKWTGTGVIHGKEDTVSVTYENTAGGSAVIETHMPGTPQEMISIYYEEDGKVVMKHFCMLKNQPVMALTNSDDNSLEFDFVSGTNMDASKDMHMHSVKFTFKDENNMIQDWTPYSDGKPEAQDTKIEFTRVQ